MSKELPEMSSTLRIIQASIQIRKNDAERGLAQAVSERQWSQLAGLKGMCEGLAGAGRWLASEAGSIQTREDLERLAQAFEHNAKECDVLRDAALARECYNDVAAHDGVATGWIAARKSIIDELNCLADAAGERRKYA